MSNLLCCVCPCSYAAAETQLQRYIALLLKEGEEHAALLLLLLLLMRCHIGTAEQHTYGEREKVQAAHSRESEQQHLIHTDPGPDTEQVSYSAFCAVKCFCVLH